MPETLRTRTNSFTSRSLLAGLGITVGAIAGVLGFGTAASADEAPSPLHDARIDSLATEPHRLVGDVADVLVRIRGGAFCSGTPITGTQLVVTAAHCVLDRDGAVASRTVVRDNVEYTAVAVLVDTEYFENPIARLDAAVLVMDEVIPGPSATLGTEIPNHGLLTLAGFQVIDSDGTLLRGNGPHDLPMPKGATGGLVEIESAPAGCVEAADSVEVMPTAVRVHCGLIPGASGGGLFAQRGAELVLVGITSNVAGDLSANGIVPLASLQDLLAHPDEYSHEVGAAELISSLSNSVLS